VAFNEVAYDNKTRNSINGRIKAMITDSEIAINEKNVKMFTVENHLNALFYSNTEVPVLIEENDRRFNVVHTGGNLRKQTWFANPDRVFEEIDKEILAFAEYLMNYVYSQKDAMEVINNHEKAAIVNAGLDHYAEFALHLKNNDADWFRENMSVAYAGKIPVLNSSIEKITALELFRYIYNEYDITMKKLTTKMELNHIKVQRLKDKKGYREYYYTW